MGIELLSSFVRDHYEVHEWKHACAILNNDFDEEWNDIQDVLTSFRLRKSHIAVPGGRKSDVAGQLDGAFYQRGWIEKSFDTKVVIDDTALQSPTHKVDCFKNHVALEVEWNNKDPFFDRDLNNFRLLFDLRAIHVGVIITRSDELQNIFDSLVEALPMALQPHISASCCLVLKVDVEADVPFWSSESPSSYMWRIYNW